MALLSVSRWHGWRLTLFSALVIGLGLGLLYLALRDEPPLAVLEGQTLTWRFQLRGPVAPSGEIVLLVIDDPTIAALGGWPLPRAALAQAVERLDGAGASVIAFDLLLLEPEAPTGPSAGDLALAAAVEQAERVVLPFAFGFDQPADAAPEHFEAIEPAAYRVHRLPATGLPPGRLHPSAVMAPFAPLDSAAELAHVTVQLDPDGALRFLHPAIGLGEAYYPALPVEVVRQHLGLDRDQLVLEVGAGVRLGERYLPMDERLRMAVNFYGPAASFPQYSLIDLLENRLPAADFADKIVLIGAVATGLGDNFVSPYAQALPGVEFFATASENLLDGRGLTRSSLTDALDLAAILLGALLASALWFLRAPLMAVAGAALLLAAWLALANLAFAQWHLWLNVTLPSAAIIMSVALVALRRTLFEYGARRRSERRADNLARYQSPLLAEHLAEGGATLHQEQSQPVVVLFVDIAGFTGLSERLTPEATVELLRSFHGKVEQGVRAHQGVIDKFMGDGAMVIFGLPEPSLGDPAAALGCARQLLDAVARWSEQLVADGQPRIAIGIGLHYGPALITEVGGESQRQLTATGDTVNVASRLEALTRDHQTPLIVSNAVVEAVRATGEGGLLEGLRPLGPQEIRGRAASLSAWALRPADEDHEAPS